jgi:hypothetical protein
MEKSPDPIDIKITFTPNDNVVADKIGLIQIVKHLQKGNVIANQPTGTKRRTEEGYFLDRPSSMNNPVYGADDLSNESQQARIGGTQSGGGDAKYELGRRTADGETTPAWLHDAPCFPGLKNGGMRFETTAVALAGPQEGKYYGSVTWGYDVDNDGLVTPVDLQRGSIGEPSKDFAAAAKKWNESKTRGKVRAKEDCTLSARYNKDQKIDVAKGDELLVEWDTDDTYKVNDDGVAVTFVWKEAAQAAGWVETDKLEDTSEGGKKTVPIPLPKEEPSRRRARQ